MSLRPVASGVAVLALVSAGSAASAQTNVALGRPVSLAAGVVEGAALSTITDGVFLPRGQQWQTDTVWWNGFDAVLEVDLGGAFLIESAIAQCDDNDAYVLLYRNLNTGVFETIWEIPNFDGFGDGMQTRPNAAEEAERFFFPGGPVLTDAVRIAAVSGDGLNSASEVQVFTVPGPGAGLLVMAAGVVAGRRGRRGRSRA